MNIDTISNWIGDSHGWISLLLWATALLVISLFRRTRGSFYALTRKFDLPIMMLIAAIFAFSLFAELAGISRPNTIAGLYISLPLFLFLLWASKRSRSL